MARNAYLVYKSDTSRLIYWIIQTSNRIINISKHLTDKDAPKANTTGRVTVAAMVALCKFIARHNITNTPSAILRLFPSVIDDRRAVHALFAQIWALTRDPAIKKSNDSHLHFINALAESFEDLVGKRWVDEGDANCCVADEDVEAKHQLDLLVLNNRFGALNMEGNEGAAAEDDDEDDDEDEDGDGVPQPASSAGSKEQRQPKGKKGARAAKAKKPHSTAELPLDSYGIAQDEDGQTHEFLFAAYAVAKDCAALRQLLQGVWREAAYNKWNVAAAGAMAKLGVAMVQRTCLAMFVDFPDHDHYGAVVDALVGGNPEQPKSGLTISEGLQRLVSGDRSAVGEETGAADVAEGLMLHTYKDLVDFVQDFRKTRSGKPTKRLLAQVRNWDPDFDLQSATKEQRIQWRREYTINFLYDLVNLFSSGVPRDDLKGKGSTLGDLDWSPDGPWAKQRRVFGMDEFAGWVTSLAMQKEGSELSKRILPHHVFQLQSIVDSFAVSRGWSTSITKGHVVTKPAKGFRPRREIEWFLHGRQGRNRTLDAGFLTGASLVRKILSVDAEGNRDTIRLLEGLERDFGNWLGESRPADLPVSPLVNGDKNALWEYSPFLCGVSLLEALEVSYQTGIHVMERLPAVTTVAYLFRLLITCTTGMEHDPLYYDLDTMLRPGFFVDGKLPTSNFGQALSSRVAMRKRNSKIQPPPHSGAKKKAPKAYDIYQSLDSTESPFSSIKSTLLACRSWNWNIDDFPDDDLGIGSVLFMIRLGSQKLVVDPATGETCLPDTDITKRAQDELGQEAVDKSMKIIFDYFPAPPSTLYDGDPSVSTAAGWGQDAAQPAGKAANSRKPRYFNLTGPSILGKVTRADICHEICGSYPLYAINYMTLTAAAYRLLGQLSVQLRQLQNPLFERGGRPQTFSRMLSLGFPVDRIYLAMEHQDEEGVRIIADVFRGSRSKIYQFMYWGHKETSNEMNERMERAAQTDAEDAADACWVM